MDLRRTSTLLTQQQKLQVVTLEQAKAQARVRHDSEDDLIAGYVEAGFDFLHGPDGWLNGYCLLREDWTAYLGCAEATTEIPLRPLADADEAAVTFARRLDRGSYVPFGAEDFVVASQDGFSTIARLTGNGFGVQQGVIDPRQYRITFSAGWDDAEQVPAPLKQAIKMLVAHYYATREASGPAVRAAGLSHEVEYGLQALAGRYRVSPDHS